MRFVNTLPLIFGLTAALGSYRWLASKARSTALSVFRVS
ncbi:hypothetical protein ACLBVB_31235, partial [Pseudomonas aeruginosa]